jgi:Protein of unknown function (DUF3419)
MSYLYNFGLSQEDERSEARALDLRPADRVLSIVSAGEMPLSLLSMGVARVLAVDIDPAQLHLARLKLAAVCTLERCDAIRFLGYRTASPDQRHDWFDAVLGHLSADSRAFWRAHPIGSGARRDLGGALRAVPVQDHPVCHPAAGPAARQGNLRVPHPGRAGSVLRLQAGPASDPPAAAGGLQPQGLRRPRHGP